MPDPSDLRRSLEEAATRFSAERTDPTTLDGRPAPAVRRLRTVPLVAAAVVALLVAGVVATAAAAGHSGHGPHRLDVSGGQVHPAPPTVAPTTLAAPSPGPATTTALPPPSTVAVVPPATGRVTPTTSSPTTTPARAPTTTSTPPVTAGTTVCQTANLKITVVPVPASTEHVGYSIVFLNHGPACTLDGYPGLDEVASGTTVASAAREQFGFLGGPTGAVGPVTLATGATASALWEGISVTVEGTSCPTYDTIRITPPGNTVSTSLPVGNQALVCRPQIHPVVAGPDGGSFA